MIESPGDGRTQGRVSTRQRYLPSLREVLLALFFVASLSPVVDYDVWLHLAAGREMWRTGRVLRTDVFSHTVRGKEWVYHEWLAAVLSYGTWIGSGINGLLVGKALLMTASMGVLLATFAVRGHGRGTPAVLGLLAAIVASHNVSLERPHLFTILFLNLFVYWLNRQRYRGTPLPWGMLAVSALWANIHGGFVLGLLAFGPFLAEDLWRVFTMESSSEEDRTAADRRLARLKRTAAMLALCAASMLLNPYGMETLLYPLQYASPSPFMRQIEEWSSPNFQRQVVLEAVLLGFVAAAMLSRRAVGVADGIFALASAHLILTGVRNTFLVGPFLGPALVTHLAQLLEQGVYENPRGLAAAETDGGRSPLGLAARLKRRVDRLDAGLFGPLLAIVVVLGCARVLTLPPRIAPNRFPSGAVDWLRRERPPGRLFNDYDFGGYLMFNLPEYPVFVDGRVDVYSKHGAFSDFLAVWQLSPDWEAVLDRRGVRIALLDQRQSLAALLGASPGWRETYRDDLSVVFVKR